MSFKYWKKWIVIWASNRQVMGFLCLLIFFWYATSDWSRGIELQSNNNWEEARAIKRTILQLTFFHPELEFFVLDLKVHHSNSMKLTFCHDLLTLQTQILTISPFGNPWQNLRTKWNAQIQEQPNYNKMPNYITNPNQRL